jgi:urease accessory protein
MTVALANVGRHGRMELTFGMRNGQTIIRDSYCEVPFKITRPVNSIPNDGIHLILMHCTAGIFGGDDLECSIRVESGARVYITQQAATRIHPSEDRLARQTIRIHVESGASLHADFEPIIPFARSRYRQNTRIDLDRGGNLTFWECMMAGRIGHSEEWQFEEFGSETMLYLNGRTVFLDRYLLRPSVMDLRSPWVMGDAVYAGTGLHCGTDSEPLAKELHEAMPNAGIDIVDSGVSLTRLVARNGPEFHRQRQTWNRYCESAVLNECDSPL